MSIGEYPKNIQGCRFLRRRELPPVSTRWDFAVTVNFSEDSAQEILLKLPEDCDLCYFDPTAEQEEGWIFVRRDGQKYFMQTVRQGSFGHFYEASLDSVLSSFMSSPFVRQIPSGYIESFIIGRIPDHQRDWHKNYNKA